MDNLKPFTGQLDTDVSTLQPFSGKLDDGESKFKSGEAFKDTKELTPDLKGLWEQFKKEWANRSNTPMTPEIAQKMMQDEHAAGSAVLDTVGALPAMAVGGLAGVGSAVTNWDASKGLKKGGEVMNALLPSTLLGNEADHEKEGYKAGMAPFTGIMDTMNAVPQGYGEMLNAMGAPNVAAQVTDAGKLGIMAVLGTKGAMHMYKSLTGKDAASVADASKKLEDIVKAQDTVPTNQHSAADRGVPPTADAPQGKLFSPEGPATKPMDTQGDLFNGMPPEFGDPTSAHADDYAAVNPYDMGGHVSASEQGRPSVIDNAQGDLLGGRTLEEAQPAPQVDPAISALHQDLPLKENTFEKGNVGSRDLAAAKQREQAAYEMAQAAEQARKAREVDAAHNQVAASKETDLNKMEAQKELDFADTASKIEATPARNFFTDPANRDLRDHQFAEDVVGDTSLMDHESTGGVVDALRRGDVHGALDIISKNHESVLYRNLADFLKGKLEGLKVVMHDEGILTLGDRHATGYYDPTTHTVGFSKVGAVSPHTVLHELIHALTSDFINSRPSDLRVMGLNGLFTKLQGMGLEKEFPNVVNVKEFLAEAFSNPEFQDFLKEHRVSNRSMWTRFVDHVKSMLGLSTSTRNHVTNALEHALDLGKQVMDAKGDTNGLAQFKDAGVPSTLADLMVSRKKPVEPVNTKQSEDVQRLKIPGLTGPISDFTFYDKPMSEIIDMAKKADDIPNTVLEKLSHQLQGGGLFESLKTRNPLVKATYERITRANQEAARTVKDNLTHPETGLVPRMREMTPQEKGEIHAAMMLVEGQRELSAQELRQKGFNEKQVAYAMKYRELNDKFFDQINEVRATAGLNPMDKRVAHIAGRFMGDFSRFVFDANGKIVARIAGSTRGELAKISKYLADKHPEWQLGKREYNTLGKGKRPADRFSGLMEAINFITKTDSDAAKLMESYRDYMQKDAINYLNATRSAKAKVKDAGGIIGSEGHKEWLDNVKNADEGMKAQIAYFEQGYSWMAMEKAVNDLKPLLGDEEVMKQTPNAAEWGKQYLDHAMGRNQGPIADAANWTASKIGELTGIGHSNLFKATNLVKHYTMQKFMGLLNIPFSITQLMQPFQVHPAMVTLLKGRGLEFSARDAQVKASHTFLKTLTDQAGPLNTFEKQALDYAEKMGIMDVKMADHTKDINESKIMETYHKIADLNITIPERLTRGNSFLFYSHLLKDAGIPTKDIFGAAENMTNMTMVNYHPIERPMGYAKLGWLGDIASTLTRYKHNQASQAAFYTREGAMSGQGVKGFTPLAAFLATSLAFGGVMGFFGFQEADSMYQLVSEKLGHPDSLTNVVLSSGMPEIISHGVFSSMGLDMTTRFSNANLIPNSIPEALMPFGSAVLDMAQSTGRFILNPGKTTGKQLIKSLAPQSVQGILENQLFTEKQPDGKNLYVNGTEGPNLGKGRVYRTDDEMAQRNFGFRSMRESKELAKNYADSQIEKGNKAVVDSIFSKVKYDTMDGKIDQAKLASYIQRAAKYGESPDAFISKLTTWQRDRHLSQTQQQQLQNALGGFRGAVNIKAGR